MSPRRLLVLLVASFVQPSTSAPAPNGGEGGPGYVTGSVQHLIGRGGTAMIPTMELGFGNPPQKVKVLLDTGSSDLVVPQTGSDICNDPQQQCSENRGGLVTGSFDAKGSDGVTRLNSRVTATYVNGVALQGNFVKAPLTLQSQTVQAMQIALVTQGKLPPGEPLFPVFGIGPIQGEAGQPYPNIPAGMKATGATKSNAFGLYLNDFRGSDGSIAFGGVDTAKFTGQLKAAPLKLNNDGQLPSFVVDFSSLALQRGGGGQQRSQNGTQAQSSQSPWQNSTQPSAESDQAQTQAQRGTSLGPRDGLGAVLIDSGAPSLDLPPQALQMLAKALGTSFNQQEGSLGPVPCSMGQQGMSLAFGFNQDNAKVVVPLELMMMPVSGGGRGGGGGGGGGGGDGGNGGAGRGGGGGGGGGGGDGAGRGGGGDGACGALGGEAGDAGGQGGRQGGGQGGGRGGQGGGQGGQGGGQGGRQGGGQGDGQQGGRRRRRSQRTHRRSPQQDTGSDTDGTAQTTAQGGSCRLPIYATNDLITLGSPFLQAAYVVFDMDNKQLLMGQAVLNAKESNVQEYTAFLAQSRRN